MYRRRKIRLSTAIVLALAACGGGTSPTPPGPPPPPPPPPPAPVATVTVTPNTANLVPLQTQALTVVTADAAGNALSGRTVTWGTNSAAVATVSSAGLVTAVGAGSATITATSEGKNGTAAITVTDGGQVTQTGGSINAAGGAVKIDVPAGAVAAPISITVTPNSAAPIGMPEGVYGVVGTSYTFGPEGTIFSAPVTVTVKYDPAKTPAWALSSDLALYHFTGGAWVKLPNLVVDPLAHTLTAQTSSFSAFTVGTGLPPAALSPAVGSVNFVQRSVIFTASIPGHTSVGLTYTWTGTGLNGVIRPLIGADAQYTMTQPQLPPGDLDQVQVIIRGNIDPTTPNVLVPLASAEAIVNANLTFTFVINPDRSTPGFAQTQSLDAVILNSDGSIYTPPDSLPVLLVWTSSEIHGSLDIHNPSQKTNVTHGVYTAKTANQSAKLPPRIDQITVDFYVGYSKVYRQSSDTTLKPDSVVHKFDVKSGTTNAFIEVAPKTYLANFTVRTVPTQGGAYVTADAAVPKVAGATSYDLTVTGIVGSPDGPSFHKVITGPTNTGSILDVYDAGPFYGVPMTGGFATTQAAIAFRQNLYQGQYGLASFVVKTTP